MSDGKWAESQVQLTLKTLETEFEGFDWQRLYDTHSAKSILPAQVGDFLFFATGVHGVIEVKETENPTKIARANFGDQQLALLRKRHKAGGAVWAVVYHTTVGVWRVIPYEVLGVQLSKSSTVDLSKHGTQFDNVLEAIIYVLSESLEDL